jgi:hypothetical protein
MFAPALHYRSSSSGSDLVRTHYDRPRNRSACFYSSASPAEGRRGGDSGCVTAALTVAKRGRNSRFPGSSWHSCLTPTHVRPVLLKNALHAIVIGI